MRIFKCLKPVIAAVNGPAVGIGVTMQLAMDIRIASENARFGFVFSQRGIVPEAASSWFLPRIVGISQALEWCYTGRVFPAQEALAGRLVSKVVPADELLPTARALAREIAAKTAPVSVALIRQMMWRMLGADDPMEAHKVDSRGIYARGRSEDVKEGVVSFLEKRPADFKNKVSADMPDYFPWWEEREYEEPRHCEERSDEAIQFSIWRAVLDRFAALAMTALSHHQRHAPDSFAVDQKPHRLRVIFQRQDDARCAAGLFPPPPIPISAVIRAAPSGRIASRPPRRRGRRARWRP